MKKSQITPEFKQGMKPSCRRVLEYLMRFGPAPLYELQRPDVGGSSAARRIRELEERYDIPYDWRYKKGSNATYYWLEFEPEFTEIPRQLILEMAI